MVRDLALVGRKKNNLRQQQQQQQQQQQKQTGKQTACMTIKLQITVAHTCKCFGKDLFLCLLCFFSEFCFAGSLLGQRITLSNLTLIIDITTLSATASKYGKRASVPQSEVLAVENKTCERIIQFTYYLRIKVNVT